MIGGYPPLPCLQPTRVIHNKLPPNALTGFSESNRVFAI